ncbi:MAG: methyltransferase domain-containing protein [Acidobacteriota bacterium]|nr:MAG: methyltransferase domain-containing protein [Acidobacteriota bacterium]
MQTEIDSPVGTMRPLNYSVMYDVEDHHWWFVGRRAIVFELIRKALDSTDSLARQILDIGCGTGATMDHLRAFGEVQGIDLSELPLGFTRRRGHRNILCASATELPFADQSFDLITALDVIEHLEDDVKGLREIRRVLQPGAPVIIFVPAFQALWGPNDDQSGHKRRYRLDSLRRAVEAAGLRIETISYANMAMFLPIWLGRRLLKWLGRAETPENRLNHPLLNRILSRVFASEAGWLRSRRLPFGVSIVCLARRP